MPLLAKQVLKADEAGGMGGSMLPGLVGDGELAQVVSSNLGLDFYPGEGLAVVATHHLSGMTSVPMASLWVKPQDGPAQELLPRPWGAMQLCHCISMSSGWWLLIPVGELVEGPLLPAPLLLSCWLLREGYLVLKVLESRGTL